MLDTFLEHSIQKNIQFYHILQASKTISAKKICEILNIDTGSIHCLIDTLNEAFDGLAYIQNKQQLVSLFIPVEVNPLKLLHAIYARSDILHCLKFLLTNDTCKPFTIFIENNFFSKSTAYRARKVCLDYLRMIGLDIKKNCVVGEEYRIRFLIALLYYKYGINCCDIDDASIALARRFISSTNQAIDLDFLNKTQNEYGYFECLLILSWKRKHFPVTFQNRNDFQPLKQLFIYPDLIAYLRATVEKELQLTFSQDDYDYIFAAYCCTNSCILADRWTRSDIDLVHEIISKHPAFLDLIERLENTFHLTLQNNRALRTALIYFAKKFILDLQCIIPDKHFYLDSKRNPATRKIIELLTHTLNAWHSENHLRYPIDPDHIRCLSIQLETILRQFTKPVHVIVISDLVIEIETMELALTTKFSAQQIQVTQFLINAQNMDFLYHLKDSVLVVTHRLSHYIKQLPFSKENCIVSISAELNSYDIQEIHTAIVHYQEENFLKEITSL